MNWISFKNKALLLILFLSFILPLGYSFWYRILPVVDAQAYDRIAVNMVEGFGFREDRTQSYQFDTSIIRAGPGYEFFLAGLYAIFGHHYEPVWVVQALLHALSALILFFICRKIFSEQGAKIGLLAAAIFGLHPDLMEISAMLMTETLYLFLIILALWFFTETFYSNKRSWWQGIVFGLVTNLAILTRPPVILFVPLIVLIFLYQKKYRNLVFFSLGLVATLMPWVVRNYFIYHQFILTTLIGSYNLWVGNTLQSSGGQIAGGFNPLTTYTTASGFFGLKSRASQEFLAFIVTYPFVFLKLCALRFIRYFSLIRPMGFWFYQSGWSQIIFAGCSAMFGLALFVGGWAGAIGALRSKKLILRTLVLFLLVSPLVLLPAVVESRYRFQAYPFLAIFFGYAISAWRLKQDSIRKIAAYVGAILIMISVVDGIIFWPVVLDHIKFFSL